MIDYGFFSDSYLFPVLLFWEKLCTWWENSTHGIAKVASYERLILLNAGKASACKLFCLITYLILNYSIIFRYSASCDILDIMLVDFIMN